MKAAIYSRKSVFTGKGESVENQVQMCKEYAEKNLGITEFIIYEDEGFSGGNKNRPKFQELIQDINKNKFDVLICYRLDRISRNVADFSATLELLQDNNISFVSIKEQFDTSTPMGKAMVYIASVFAQLERETIAERIRDNMIQLSKTGRWLGGQTPLGFKSEQITYIDSEFKERSMSKLIPIGYELEQVKLIFDKYLEAGSIHMVLKYLLANNIKGKNGGDFASMSVNDILRNPVYVQSTEDIFEYLSEKEMLLCGIPNGNGILIYNKRNSKYKYKDTSQWIAAVSKHKGIISSNDWLEVQRKLDNNAKKENPRQGTSKKSLLSGILKCAKCGAPMRVSYGRPRKDNKERIYYYMCTMKAHSAKSRCDNPNVRGDKLEKTVIEHIKNLNTDMIMKELEKYKEKTASTQISYRLDSIERDIDQKRKDMDALLKQLAKLDSTCVASEFILSKIDELGNKIKELQTKLISLKNKKQEATANVVNSSLILDTIKEFNSFFDSTLDNSENTIMKKRYLLETIIDKITWNGESNDIHINLWGSKKK